MKFTLSWLKQHLDTKASAEAIGETLTRIGLEVEELFERFHRIENARSRSNEGSGIGLALVRELVGLHGGTIDVASAIDRGTIDHRGPEFAALGKARAVRSRYASAYAVSAAIACVYFALSRAASAGPRRASRLGSELSLMSNFLTSSKPREFFLYSVIKSSTRCA